MDVRPTHDGAWYRVPGASATGSAVIIGEASELEVVVVACRQPRAIVSIEQLPRTHSFNGQRDGRLLPYPD